MKTFVSFVCVDAGGARHFGNTEVNAEVKTLAHVRQVEAVLLTEIAGMIGADMKPESITVLSFQALEA